MRGSIVLYDQLQVKSVSILQDDGTHIGHR